MPLKDNATSARYAVRIGFADSLQHPGNDEEGVSVRLPEHDKRSHQEQQAEDQQSPSRAQVICKDPNRRARNDEACSIGSNDCVPEGNGQWAV